MVLISSDWNSELRKFIRTYLADAESDFDAGFDPESANGSMIFVIATKSIWIKNSTGKWQKCGTNEVK